MANRKRRLIVKEVVSMLEDDDSIQNARVYIQPPDTNEESDGYSGEEDEGGDLSNLSKGLLSAPATATVFRYGQQEDFLGLSDDSEEESQLSPGLPDNETSACNAFSDWPSQSMTETQPMQSKVGNTTSILENNEVLNTLEIQRHKEPYNDQHPEGKRKLQITTGQPSAKKLKSGTKTPRRWRHIDLSDCQKSRFPWDSSTLCVSCVPKSPADIFEMFFDQEVLEMIVGYSIKYAQSKGNMTFSTNPKEIQTFIGILLVSGYSPVSRNMYWSSDVDVANQAISKAMTRNRFEEIMKYIHLSDNKQLDTEDKYSKVRPLLSILNKKFLAYFKILDTQNLSIGESIIPYYVYHGNRESMEGKSIELDYKMLVLTTQQGYTIQFEPQQETMKCMVENTGVGKRGSAVLNLVSELQPNSGCSYHLTLDSACTSLQLVDTLINRKIGCTGVIHSSLIEECPLKDTEAMEKTARGTYEYATDIDSGLLVVRWNDKSVVDYVSNVVGVDPVKTSQRWSRTESSQITIRQPQLICHYNNAIGVVDRMDKKLNKYRIHIKSKKWWWPLFSYCIDLCILQTWHLHNATTETKNKITSLLDVRRSVARSYLIRRPHANLGRPKSLSFNKDKRVPKEVRFDRKDHLVEPWATQLRCASCGMKTKHRCSKCMVGVHDRCFIRYHSAEQPSDC